MKDENVADAGHPADAVMAGYVLGTLAPTEQGEVEEHCVICRECCAQLALLIRAIGPEENEEEQRQVEALLPLGQQAAARAREQISQDPTLRLPGAEKKVGKVYSSVREGRAHVSGLWSRGRGRWPYLPHAVVATALVVIGITGYFTLWSHSPATRGLEALRQAYRHSRPLEARVTGGFGYHSYERTRGPAEATGIDRDQLNHAFAALTGEVAAHPTAQARHALGQLYLLRGDFNEAEYQLTLALDDAPRDAKLQADLAALFYERGKREESVTLLAKAVEHNTEAIKLEPKLVEAWFNRALCYEQMVLPTDAQKDWERYLELDPDSQWAEEARAHLKKLRERAESPEERDRRVQAAFLSAETAGDETAMRQLVSEHFVTVKDLVAEPLLDEFLSSASMGADARTSQSLKRLARIGQLASEIKGDQFLADAIDFAARGSPAVKRELQTIRATLRQADQEHLRDSFDAASALYASARIAAERIGDLCHAETAIYGLIRYPKDLQAEPPDLSTFRSQLIAETDSRRHRQLQAQALVAVGNAYISSMQLSRAIDLNLQGAEIAKELGDTETAVNGLRLAGAAYALIGDYEGAVKKNYEALSLLRDHSVTPRRAAQSYIQMADTLSSLGNYLAALPYQQESLRMAEHSSSAVLPFGVIGRLGLTYVKLERYEEAIRYLNDAVARAEAIKDNRARIMAKVDLYTTLGDFHLHQNKADEAIASYRDLIKTISETPNRYFLPAAHQGIAAAYLKKGLTAEAEAELKTSIDLAEQDRAAINDAHGRSAFLANRQSVYHAMINLQFADKHDHARAFNYAETAKSRELLDTLKSASEVKWSDSQIKLMLSDSALPLTLEEMQQALPAHAQLVEYTVTEQRLIIWLVTRHEVVPQSVPISADQLRRLVADYLDELRTRRGVELLNRRAAELYKLLISPIAAHLDRNRVLCIVPDGVLHQLPFAALVEPKAGRYLVEEFALVTNPSASVLAQTLESTGAKPSRATEKFLGLSNPRFNQQRFKLLPTLPAAEQELARAQALYPQHQVLSRDRATESALTRQMADYEVVHLATHILVNGQSPLLSSIVLADEDGRAPEDPTPGRVAFDGALHAYEIAQLKLQRTRLVILSGCRSGLGDYIRGEALSGLAQAFFAAGVSTVIASLWDVDDESTAELMTVFHEQHHTQKKQGFASALRQAQLSLLNIAAHQRRHPYYWAAFIIAGDGLSE